MVCIRLVNTHKIHNIYTIIIVKYRIYNKLMIYFHINVYLNNAVA